MEEAANLARCIEWWMRVDDGAEVPARSIEEAAAILPYSALLEVEPQTGAVLMGRHRG